MSTKPANKETANLTRELTRICEALELRYGGRKPTKPADFIEALVYQILELGTSEKNARDSLRRIHDEYIDWNDARVASVREIEDILGPRYYMVREKSEDIRQLLADIYTAFRTMSLGAQLTPEGVETLLALPETTNVRKDMVERALVLCHETHIFPCDEDQFVLLKFLSGLFKNLTLQQGQEKTAEALSTEFLVRLSRGLREHVHVYQNAGEDEPQIIAFNWDQPDPLKMDKGKNSAANKAKEEKPKKAEKIAPVAKEKAAPVAKAPSPVDELEPTTDRVIKKVATAKISDKAPAKPIAKAAPKPAAKATAKKAPAPKVVTKKK